MNIPARGVLFKAEMIRALLNTQCDVWPAKAVDESKPWKSQTRCVIDPQPTPDFGQTIKLATYHPEKVNKRTGELYPGAEVFGFWNEDYGWVCPHPPGSILYAKETFRRVSSGEIKGGEGTLRYGIEYKAGGVEWNEHETKMSGWKDTKQPAQFNQPNWKPSIFMPKAAARLWFRVMNVRVERVNEISGDDARAEGTHGHDNQVDANAIGRYRELWDSINGEGDFEKGRFVFAYDIARISRP